MGWLNDKSSSIKLNVLFYHFSAKPHRMVMKRARLPKMNMGMVNNKQAAWMPPMIKNTVLLPATSSQPVKKREKMSPWRMSRLHTQKGQLRNENPRKTNLLLEKFNVTSASAAYCR